MGSKPASVAIIAVSQVAAMALWFSASAVVPSLVAEFKLSNFMQAAFTSAVQVGFVIGCLASALLGLADRIDPRRFFAVSAASAGTTAEAENHNAIAATWLTAMIVTDAGLEDAATMEPQIFGSVTPFCPWYFPPRSLYEVSQTSSDSKKITCATPSLA